MTLDQLATPLKGKVLVRGADIEKRRIRSVVASDLMSDVLVATLDDFLLLTSLASDQMIRTADLVGAAGVVVVNGKRLPPSILQLAESLNMTLIQSPLSKYDACLALGAALHHAPEPEPCGSAG